MLPGPRPDLPAAAAFRAQALIVSVTDDAFATDAGTRRLLSYLPGLDPQEIRVGPAEVGARALATLGSSAETRGPQCGPESWHIYCRRLRDGLSRSRRRCCNEAARRYWGHFFAMGECPAAAVYERMVSVSAKPIGQHAGSARVRDPDVEQAWLRVAIGSVRSATRRSWSYLKADLPKDSSPPWSRVGGCAGRRLDDSQASPEQEHVIALRYLAIVTDISVITIAMAGADEAGVPFVGLYLWVTVGMGFGSAPVSFWRRIGSPSLATLAFCCSFPFWIQHRAFAIGLLVTLTVVPLYVLVLLTRLTAQKDAAEQLSNAKSRFVANVSHELRTPLTGVFAVYDLLRGRKMTPDDRNLSACSEMRSPY